MRLAPIFVLCAACAGLAAADITIGRWNGMLLVTAPADSSTSKLGSRLNQRITLDARDMPLTEVADFLRSATGLNLVIAPTLLAQPPSITMQVKEMELGNLFNWIERMASVHIGFVRGAVYISDQPVAGASTTRIYDVSDLTLPIRNFPGPDMTIAQNSGSTLLPPPEEPQSGQDLDSIEEFLNRFIARQSD